MGPPSTDINRGSPTRLGFHAGGPPRTRFNSRRPVLTGLNSGGFGYSGLLRPDDLVTPPWSYRSFSSACLTPVSPVSVLQIASRRQSIQVRRVTPSRYSLPVLSPDITKALCREDRVSRIEPSRTKISSPTVGLSCDVTTNNSYHD